MAGSLFSPLARAAFLMDGRPRRWELGALCAALLVAVPATTWRGAGRGGEDTRVPSAAQESAHLARPPAVRWEPVSPTDGSALAITVEAPEDAPEMTVTAHLGGRSVRFGRLAGSWFGLAPLPSDRTGPVELRVTTVLPGEAPAEQRWTVQVRPHTYGETELSVAPRFTNPPADVMERIERERELVRSTLRHVTPEWLINGNFVRPRNTRITSPFGQKRVFNGELQSRHWGVDLAGDVGAEVRVAGRGRVAIARDLYYAGNAIYVDHGLGVFSGYYHLSRIDVSEGDIVERGQVIGQVGASGRVTGPHLHWSFFVDAERLDASSVLDLVVPETPTSETGVSTELEGGPRAKS